MLRRPHLRRDDGQVLVLTGAVLIVFLFMGTLVIDVGNWFNHRRHLQTQVDAAALATASDFTNCFLSPATANAAIKTSALKYAGDLNRNPLSENAQVKPDKSVHVVLNSSQYWPAATALTEDNPGITLGTPCSRRFIDVKATDDDVPGLLRIIPFLPDIRAHARAESRRIQSLTGLMPWGVPETEPTSVWALFVDESDSANLPLALKLNKQSVQLVNGSNYQIYGAAAPGVTIPPKTSVVIFTSTSATPTTTGSLAAICGQSSAIGCHAGSASTDGLGFIRQLVNPNPASASNPVLVASDFGAGDCTTDTSAGYFLYNANCSPQVTATINFGTGASDPTAGPTFARAYLVSADCPPGVDPGCPMSYRTSDQKWVISVPQVGAGTGQHPYSIAWKTGGSGPGAPVLTAFTGGAAGTQQLAVQKSTPGATRTLASAAAAQVSCSTGSTITVRKTLVNNGVALGAKSNADFSFTVNKGAQTCDPSPVVFNAGGVNSFTVDNGGNSTYGVTEVGAPIAGYTTSYSVGNKTNCASMSKTDTCTITNTAVVGTLNVTKVVTNDDAGTKTPSDFQFRVSDQLSRITSPITFPAGSTTSTSSLALFAGSTVDVVEIPDAGYTTTYSGCSNIVISQSTPRTCTITNDDVGPGKGTLVVQKVVTNNDGGAKTFANFSFKIDSGVSQPFNAVGQVTVAVTAGPHTVVEDPDASYTTTYQNCSNVNVPKGGVATCIITNDDKPGSLTIIKQVVGAPNLPSEWTMTIAGPTSATFPGAGGAGTTRSVNAGSYAIGEIGGPAGFGLTFPAGANQDCSLSGTVTVANGASKTCVLANTFGGVGGPPAIGTFDGVGRIYAADSRSGNVGYLRITSDGATPAYFFSSVGGHNFNISVGLAGSLKASAALDPLYLLRWASGSGSRTQLLDCDKANLHGGPDEEIRDSCYTRYQTSVTNSCVPDYDSPSDLPPDSLNPNPIPDCISVKTGTISSLGQGLHDRFEDPCTDNNWPKAVGDPPPPFDDRRWVNLVVTGPGVFFQNGAGNVPIIRFASFYVTGWGAKGPKIQGCPGLPNGKKNDPPPPQADTNNDDGDVWGHFSTYSLPAANGDPSESPCPLTEATVCTLILTR